jgi:putative hydrolase of the HAD superfamily
MSAFPDARPCLDRLARAGHRLGVISNGQGVMQRHKLGLAGLVDCFDCIVISEESGCAKPAAEIFLHACRNANEPVTNALYVGDRYDLDAEGARLAGLRGVWLDRAGRATDQHVPPIVRSLDELAVLVLAHPPQREVIA